MYMKLDFDFDKNSGYKTPQKNEHRGRSKL
jgi:hypothetical protein